MTSTRTPTRADKARGLLLGTGLGNALGAPFEGRDTVPPDALAAEEHAPSLLVHTDDTVLTVVLAEHLAARRDPGLLDENRLAREFAAAWQREPWRGYGTGSPQVFGLLHAGVPWREAAHAFLDTQGSQGNGAAMRVAPVALVATSAEHAVELADRSTTVAHAHPTAGTAPDARQPPPSSHCAATRQPRWTTSGSCSTCNGSFPHGCGRTNSAASPHSPTTPPPPRPPQRWATTPPPCPRSRSPCSPS
ncbi:ADP-ribosylglycohydrolase family protein [Saccharothrix sp. S26]|nr:ADP-ribosylglycohydrolase family protein [Saccharothrix sp. S26]MCE6995496.1 ADP-ribosylglycohydrolase family protein [Saccharothrix sp. S26]